MLYISLPSRIVLARKGFLGLLTYPSCRSSGVIVCFPIRFKVLNDNGNLEQCLVLRIHKDCL